MEPMAFQFQVPTLSILIDTVSMGKDIAGAKAKGVDDIVVFIHWGNEYERFPNTQQKIWQSGYMIGALELLLARILMWFNLLN